MVTHKDLDIWKMGLDLVEKAYRITQVFPKDEQFGLIAQMRRAAVSIPSNSAEEAARNSKKEFLQYLYVSLGSLSESEIETQLLISQRLGYLFAYTHIGIHA
jgi:four helix bundle protein